VTFPQKVQQVTPRGTCRRVAKEYLKEDQSTTGWFIPVLPSAEKGFVMRTLRIDRVVFLMSGAAAGERGRSEPPLAGGGYRSHHLSHRR